MRLISSFLFVFAVLPLTAGFALLWFKTKMKLFLYLLAVLWTIVFGFLIMITISHVISTKKTVKKSDIYGEYIIDRSQFPGPQADWQYDNFRFEITKKNQLIFHQTNGPQIMKSDTMTVEFLEQYTNDRILIHRTKKIHHVIEKSPTLYRTIWSFYYVSKSPKFGNIFFKKGTWKPIAK